MPTSEADTPPREAVRLLLLAFCVLHALSRIFARVAVDQWTSAAHSGEACLRRLQELPTASLRHKSECGCHCMTDEGVLYLSLSSDWRAPALRFGPKPACSAATASTHSTRQSVL